jgi:L-alanine-DL-glutamate epimerase-like enolase superfamily enzyme
VKIIAADVTDVVMPKEDPKWRFALGARPESLGVLLRLQEESGAVGYGFASEIPHLGYPLVVLRTVVHALAEQLVGQDARERRPLVAKAQKNSGGCKPATAAVGMALFDLSAQAMQIPAYQMLGGAFRRTIPVLRILPLKTPEEVAAGAKRHVEEGYKYLKIKLDNESLDLDEARVRAVRAAVGDDVHLTLDANQSYSPKEAVEFYRRVRDQRIDLFEQPVAARDFAGLKFVTDSVDCRIEADESAASLEDIYRLVRERAVDSVSLKVLKLGGLDALREAATICKAGNVQCRLGATVGSRLLNAAAMHFVAATENIDYACEVGEFARLLNDPFEGLEVENGELVLSDAPGFGVRLRGQET